MLYSEYSDYAPILSVTNSNTLKPKWRFRFQNWWITEDDFHESVAHAWAHTSTGPFRQRTQKLVATYLKVWIKKKKPLNQQLADVEQEILQIQQAPPNVANHSKEQSLAQLYDPFHSRQAGNTISNPEEIARKFISYFHICLILLFCHIAKAIPCIMRSLLPMSSQMLFQL